MILNIFINWKSEHSEELSSGRVKTPLCILSSTGSLFYKLLTHKAVDTELNNINGNNPIYQNQALSFPALG